MVLPKVPIVPQWNLSSGCVCTPEGGFMYVGARSVNYIGPIVNGAAPFVKAFHTRQAISSLDIDPGWGKQVNIKDANSSKEVHVGAENEATAKKYFAVLAQDNSVQIWDFDKGCAVSGHKAHFSMARYMEGKGPGLSAPQNGYVLLSFMCDRNVLSVHAQELVIYCVASNMYCRHTSFLPARNQQWTVLRCSPYNRDIFALGSSRGLILVGDLKQMRVVYTLRGHDASITALAWRKVEAKDLEPLEEVKEQSPKLVQAAETVMPPVAVSGTAPTGDDIFDIYDYDYLENEFGAPAKEAVTSGAKKCGDKASEFVGIEKPLETENPSKQFDFAEACRSLKEDINSLQQQQSTSTSLEKDDIVTLADCQKATEAMPPNSSSCDSNASTEGSLEVIEHDSSSCSDSIEVAANNANFASENKPTKQILHQAEVHATQTLERPVTIKSQQNLPTVTTESHLKLTDMAGHVLLASASVDGNVWMWNTSTGSSCDNIRARGSPVGANGGRGQQKGKNIHIEVGWIDATKLLTANKYGELTLWTLQSTTNIYKLKEHKRHFVQRGVVSFSICSQLKTLWCISTHRDISCESLEEEQLIAKYCCASTNISAMRECPDDMNKIALGFSDRRIGIIDISQMSATNIQIETFGLRIDSPVQSLVWSPDSKYIAFGTIEGRLGILNVENPKLQPQILNPVCGKVIYSLDWHANYIFVVCNEMLAVYDERLKSKDAHIISGLPPISTVSVRSDYLFVGSQRGHFQIYRQKFDPHTSQQQPPLWSYELLQDLDLGPRYITDIAWSPIVPGRLAVVANMNPLYILQFDAVKGLVHKPPRRIEMKNPKAANASVKWSNRSPHRLLTCGFDGAVRIWDLNCAGDPEQYLKQYNCPMTCGLFLPTDENIVFCAGKATSLEFFDTRVDISADYSLGKWKRSNLHPLDNIQWAVKMPTQYETKAASERRRHRRGMAGVEPEAYDYKLTQAPEIAEMLSALSIEENFKTKLSQIAGPTEYKKAPQQCEDLCSSVFLKKPTTLLYLTTKELNKQALEKLAHLLSTQDGIILNTGGHCAKLFGSRAQAKELLVAELSNHQSSETRGISSLLMPQMTVNVKEEIMKCIQQKRLTAWHVALAPTLSYDFWKKCCIAFADQLLEQGYALQAASYMLAVHKHNDAIQMLLERSYFKEALLMARIYLQPEDPLLNSITQKWILNLEAMGNLPAATLLSVLSGNVTHAYETLAKIRNPTQEMTDVLNLLQSKAANNSAVKPS